MNPRPTGDAPGGSRPLRIAEIFYSLQGETSRTGLPTVFVRLTGCPLRCTWCDTSYAFDGGTWMSQAEVLQTVATWSPRRVCVTGGEPLAQKPCLQLLRALCEAGYEVSLETSGALDIAGVDARVSRVVDLKAPSSGESLRQRWQDLALLTPHDELKAVIANRSDYEWVLQRITEHAAWGRCPILFSPVAGLLTPETLAQWILDDRLEVRLQLQLHKILWRDRTGC